MIKERQSRWVVWVSLALLLTVALGATTVFPSQAAPMTTPFVYLPLITKPVDCSVPDQNFGDWPIIPPPTETPAAEQGDINLELRGYEPTTAYMGLVNYNGGTDAKAPQLAYLFGDLRVPAFSNGYQIHAWDWSCNCRGDVYTSPDVTLLGMAVTPGEIIYTPDSGYDIGGGYDVLVLYATPQRITLKYTGEDNVVYGYTIHIEDVCVDPQLVALYEAWNANGRSRLPALRGGQALGRALGNEIKVSIRDTGAFMDPRSAKDWWQRP